MFDRFFFILMAAIAGTAFLAALYHTIKAARTRGATRAGYLDDCKGLFSGGMKAIMPTGFPRMSGNYRGHEFDLQVVADTLNIRKLPTLWLMVTLPENLPVHATFDLMVRPRGVETFSRHAQLPVQISNDGGFPEDSTIRTDNPAALPPRDLLRRHLPLFNDGRAKELVISPKGLRVVWLADEAHRGKYLIFRDSEMGLVPFRPDDLKPLLDYLIGLREDILAHARRTDTP